MIRLKYLIQPYKKSKIQAGEGQSDGPVPFYTSSEGLKLYYNYAQYPSDSISMGTGGFASINYSKVPFSTSTDCFNFSGNKKSYTKFLYYWIYSRIDYVDDLYFWGMGLKHLQKPYFLNEKLVLPTLDKQKQIADFLDKRVGYIDRLISSYKLKIEENSTYRKTLIEKTIKNGINESFIKKDSGIAWIGNINDSFNVCKLKYVLKNKNDIKCGPFGSSLTGKVIPNGDYLVYGQWNLTSRNFNYKRNTVNLSAYKQLQNYRVRSNDILLSMMGTIGKAMIVPNGITEGIMDSHIIKIKLDKDVMIDDFFIYQYDESNSDIVMKYFYLAKKGSIMDGLNTSIVKNAFLVVPPISEQKKIVEFLNKKTTIIDKLLSNCVDSINLLQDYKKSLIYEYVSGKKEVPHEFN